MGCGALILGNDLARKKVFPTPQVVDNPVPDPGPSVSAVFPACAQSRKFDEVLNFSDFLCSVVDEPVKTGAAVKNEQAAKAELALKVDRHAFIKTQQSGPTLAACVTILKLA